MWLSLTPIGSIHQKFWPNPKHHDGDVTFPHFARACCLLACLLLAACCLLLAACCLLLTKPSGSTLDTKEGYKTKTGSTNSVTLIKTEYWDRVVGEGTSAMTGEGHQE